MTTRVGDTAFDEHAAFIAKFFKLCDEGEPVPDELTAEMNDAYSRMTEAEKLEYGRLCGEAGRNDA